MSLPNPSLSFNAYDTLPASQLNQMQANITALAAGTGLNDGAVPLSKLSTGSAGAWTSWTPTITNFTVGNGTVIAKYSQVGKTINCRIKIVFGSTTAITGGTGVNISLPFTAHADYGTQQHAVGTVYFEDAGLLGFTGYIRIYATNTASIEVSRDDATYGNIAALQSNVPFTWGANDYLGGTFTYEAA